MDKDWRPKGWDNPYKEGLLACHWLGMPSLKEAYEEGASAIIPAVCKNIGERIERLLECKITYFTGNSQERYFPLKEILELKDNLLQSKRPEERK